MPNIGPAEILVIFVVALLVFGPNKLPEIGRQVGRAAREFRRIQSQVRDELQEVVEPPDHAPPRLTARAESAEADHTTEGGDDHTPSVGPPERPDGHAQTAQESTDDTKSSEPPTSSTSTRSPLEDAHDEAPPSDVTGSTED